MKNIIILLSGLILANTCLAGMKLCFHINGQLHCIDIPVEVNHEWPWDIRHVGDIRPEILNDLAILNVMDHLAGQLTPELGEFARQNLHDLGLTTDLPETFSLSIRSQKTDGSPFWTFEFRDSRNQIIQLPVQQAFGLDMGPQKFGICEPDPEPWIVHPELDLSTIQNLKAIASIAELTGGLSPRVGGQVESVLGRLVDNLNLPKNVQVQF